MADLVARVTKAEDKENAAAAPTTRNTRSPPTLPQLSELNSKTADIMTRLQEVETIVN